NRAGQARNPHALRPLSENAALKGTSSRGAACSHPVAFRPLGESAALNAVLLRPLRGVMV
ncbi:MAG: hypothetical protein SO099_00550, partial [Ruthenibacterium lactatiformans]|nr:hypothetical protein [Ruthenibacterium lactatiformans]